MKKLNYIILAAISLSLVVGCANASSKSNDWNQPNQAQETQLKRLHGMQLMPGIYEVTKANNRNQYPIAMAEKRAVSRAVLKLAGLYKEGMYGEDEMEAQPVDK